LLFAEHALPYDGRAMDEPQPTVISINISPGGIPKTPVDEADVTVDGLAGDAHNHEKHRGPINAISLIDVEDLADFCDEGFEVYPGAMGENVTVRGLSVDSLHPGDRVRFSGGVEIELVKARKPCYVLDSISPQLKKDVVGRCGFIAKVVSAGTLRPGETIEVKQREPGSVTPGVKT
jgi:MOSC domain-containing protein YiiM